MQAHVQKQGVIMLFSKSVEVLALRLSSGSDIRRDLEALTKSEKISAAVIIGAVGSLSQVAFDMPTTVILLS